MKKGKSEVEKSQTFVTKKLPQKALNQKEKRRLFELRHILSGKDRKQKIPDTAQKTITFERMYRDGTCQVTHLFYTRMVEFFDINYELLDIDEQGDILNSYSKFLNYFDPSVKFQLFLFNRQVNEKKLMEQVELPLQGDEFFS